jgi:hypothetical protein
MFEKDMPKTLEELEEKMTQFWDLVASSSCTSTIGGWVWYCDSHDTHGNADSREEATWVAKAHKRFHRDPDGCPITITEV